MSYPNPDEPENQESQGNDAELTAQKEVVLKQILAPDARSRINNIRMVKPELAMMVENYIIALVTQGRVGSQISDDQLKKILLSLQQPKRDFKINRI